MYVLQLTTGLGFVCFALLMLKYLSIPECVCPFIKVQGRATKKYVFFELLLYDV